MARNLDLTQLTEDEAQHVFQVVQRDMNLRKQEDERLGELKCRIEEEGTKRKFLTKQAKFNEGHCIHCLESFQFLMNCKRPCLDCSLNICKNCSKFNKKEYGWVCDSCRIIRIVKTASLDWFYSHVTSRFKNFGSATVMHSLSERDQSVGKDPLQHLEDLNCEEDDYDHESDSYFQCGYTPHMMTDVIGEAEDTFDHEEDRFYSTQRRNKRLLSVHHFDFDMDSEYSAQSRRQSLQLTSPHFDGNDFQSCSEMSSPGNGAAGGGSRKGSLVENPELSAVFRSILQEKSQNLMPDQLFSTEVRFEINTRRKSLDKPFKTEEAVHREQRVPHSPSIPGIWISAEDEEEQQFLPRPKQKAVCYTDLESSDNDEAPEHPVYRRHLVRSRSKSSSQESPAAGGTQISDLSKRMSSIERMLSRLEEKITPTSVKSPDHKVRQEMSSPAKSDASGLDWTDADLEEGKLKKKLDELASNISDRGPSSEDELRRKTENPREISSSIEDPHVQIPKVSQVENWIAALNVAGMNASLPEKPKSHQGTQAKMVSDPPSRKNSTGNSISKKTSHVNATMKKPPT